MGTFGCQRLVVLTSRDAHYSIKKAAFVLGIGTDVKLNKKNQNSSHSSLTVDLFTSHNLAFLSQNTYLVDVDDSGRMSPSHLRNEIERALKENARPFVVAATAGEPLNLRRK